MNPDELPTAVVAPARPRSWTWILPVLALALAAYLVIDSWGARGPLIHVRVDQGHGLKAGDQLRYRGIQVGSVVAVSLSPTLADVVVGVRLDPAASGLARAGSRIWIVRPQLTLDSIQGLETVVGARYLAVLPGPPDARRQTEFVALEEAPVPELLEAGGLEITLEASRRHGLIPGAALTYRGIQVGTVLSAGLSSDATVVEIRAYVRPSYAALVRANTVFWKEGGIKIGATLTGGLSVDVGTLRSLVVGAIALATPEDSGAAVSTGQRFVLHEKAEDEWTAWAPALPIGAELLPAGAHVPRLVRATLSWKLERALLQGRFSGRSAERAGWVFRAGDALIVPEDLVTPPANVLPESVALEVAGKKIALEGIERVAAGGLARLQFTARELDPFDASHVRPMEAPEDALVLSDPSRAPRALSAARISADDGGWKVDDALGFDEEWHGATVLSRRDGALLGVLLVEKSAARIAPLAPLVTK